MAHAQPLEKKLATDVHGPLRLHWSWSLRTPPTTNVTTTTSVSGFIRGCSIRVHPWPLFLFVVRFLAAIPAAAQVGTTTDIITGTITGPDHRPLAEAMVQVTSLETQVSRERSTDPRGHFTIVFPDGGGQYQLLVRMLGMSPVHQLLVRQADEDRLVATIQMNPVGVEIPEITVRARTRRPTDRTPPGSTERNLNPELIDRLPIDASDLNTLATLAPGVVGVGATDTTDAAFSVAGQRTSANDITLDGMSFGSGSVPQDAVRSTRVVTNTYDVARGQFSGGLVASTTKSGTNVPQGSFTYNLRDQALAWGGVTSSPFSQGSTQQQLGGGMGGPIVRNKLFIFGSLQGRWRDQALTSLTTADDATLARLGVSPDSAARFIDLAGATGVPSTVSGIPDTHSTDNATGLLRLDWNPSGTETIMLRLDGRWNSQDPTRIGALALPATGGTSSGYGGGIMASLTSYFGGNFINELHGYVSINHREGDAYLLLPQGRVQVVSDASDTTGSVAAMSFGGNPGFPQTADNNGLELSNEFSWLPGGATHRIKLGLYLNGTGIDERQTQNQFGTFLFASLANLEANRPAQFSRNIAPAAQSGTAWNSAAYLGDTWRPKGGFQLAYGARLEQSSFSGAPAYNPSVDSSFGVRTDRIPNEVHFSPRVGFTWTFGGSSGPPKNILRGGVGDFRSLTPTSLYGSALAASGTSDAESQLICIGSGVPIPDWNQYLADPSSIPTQCADSVSAVVISPRPNVTVFAPGFAAPRAWRASLGFQRRIHTTWTASVDASYARGKSQYGYRDLNLSATPSFTLADEGNRPVYVPADSIIAATGASSSLNSRIDSRFGQVFEIGSDLESDTRQVIVGVGNVSRSGASFQLSYTWTRARDQSSYSGGSASQGFASPTTGGNPNVAEWATSSFQREHSILGTATFPITTALEVTGIARLTSGAPFTPLVGEDINGDGARNDRAFIFEPATAPDTAIANGMRTLLAGVSPRVRECLEKQSQQVAARNSCVGPWQPSLDLQINWRPNFFGLDRRLTLSLLTVNLLGGIDSWVHGADDIHGWGFAAAPDATLLYVRGFDPANQRFIYGVNSRFGASQGSNGGSTVPFQLALQGHLTIGPDRTRDRLRARDASRGGGAGGGRFGGGGGGFGGGDFASRMAQALPNPITPIMALKDSLHLSPEEMTSLQSISDTVEARNKIVGEGLQEEIRKAGANPDQQVLFARLRPGLTQARENIRLALEQAKGVLTPAQWSLLPDDVKMPRRGGGNR